MQQQAYGGVDAARAGGENRGRERREGEGGCLDEDRIVRIEMIESGNAMEVPYAGKMS
jgi:hypothetical protein